MKQHFHGRQFFANAGVWILEDTFPGEIFGKYFLFESIKHGDWKKDIVKITSIAIVCLGSVSTREAIR